jgi:hypothetical protein
VKTYSGDKPNYTEPTIDAWPLYSGLPPAKVQDERETQYKSWAQSAQVIGTTQREWVGLTDEEIADVFGDYMDSMDETEEDNNWGYERLIEAKLREKNA